MTGHDVFLILDEDYAGDLAELSRRGHSSGRVKIRTWSGRGDREVGLEDLEPD